MSEAWDCPEVALKEARKAARYIHEQSRGVLEFDELVSIGYMWIASHKEKVLAWSDKEQHPLGWKAMGKSMLRAMSREVSKERARRTGGDTTDQFYYKPGLVMEVLPDIWDLQDRLPTALPTDPDVPKNKTMAPGEGGNREAIIADVSRAVGRLNDQERSILQARFYSNLTVDEIAKIHGLGDATIERKLNNIIRSVIDYLGGESPWRTKRHRSTAHAIAETRNQWEGDDQ